MNKKIISGFMAVFLLINLFAPTLTVFAQEQADVEPDVISPKITDIKVVDEAVTVEATDDIAIHAQGYSFDGGTTWQESNVFISKGSYEWSQGTILVRDTSENTSHNIDTIKVTLEADTAPPEISEIKTEGLKVIVEATDNIEIHAQGYSFDGGTTWQESNFFISNGSYEWSQGAILVRDTSENTNHNIDTIKVTSEADTTPPEISEIKTEGLKVIVEATDDIAMHAQGYSFDGGKTWQEENQFTSDKAYTWAENEILVQDAQNNISNNTEAISVEELADTDAPIISAINTDGLTVTVIATDNVAIHDKGYSFNGGATWQSSSKFTANGTYKWVPGTIMVRDIDGNINYNRVEVLVATSNDTTPPVISSIDVNDFTVTVNATDNVAIHSQGYSFNGGATWQVSNKFTANGTYKWVPGTIMVRDTAGNINYNRTEVSVSASKDTVAPVISSIDVDGFTVTVKATDNVAIHSQGYSFNGGATWQASNKFTANGTYKWVPGTIMVRDTAGNINYNRTEVSVGASKDTVAPVISSIDVDGFTVTVKATDNVAIHSQGYSFNGGTTWQASNKFTANGTYKWVPGTIMVRDTAGNINYNRTEVSVGASKDTVAPVISSIDVDGFTVTVKATDNVAIHSQGYSFNGGTTWQASNKFTTSGTYKWVPGTIMVRDTAGNINYNRIDVISGERKDTTPPKISAININGMTITVVATDDVKLHNQPYSFDSGKTWRSTNTFTLSKAYTWAVGTIWVRDAKENISKNTSPVVVNEPEDKTPPVISAIDVNEMTVTILATDDVKLHDEPYSFDSGLTWRAENTFTASKAYTWAVGTIWVRDAKENISKNTSPITVGDPEDTTPPIISDIDINGMTITVVATDNVKLHSEPYSFDGGLTWRATNTFTASKAYTWAVGTIQVRDAKGNISKNTSPITVGEVDDTTPPTISAININGMTITVVATDNVKLHSEPYSFDSGKTWRATNTFTLARGYTWQVGTIQVRDAKGNISKNTYPVVVNDPEDKTPPTISSIDTYGYTVTVNATDNIAIHAQGYSFNGGTTWQASNKFTATGEYTWVSGTIMVKDKSGNISYNRSAVTVGDKQPPTILSITTYGFTVTVNATDDVGIHAQGYSFNGGVTWQASNTFNATGEYTWVPGTIIVRDISGKTSYNTKSVTVKDLLAPEVSITAPGNTNFISLSDRVVVDAKDDTGLHPEAYSFNGGTTWQKENYYLLTGPKTWIPGTICVRDNYGNMGYNKSTVTADKFITITNQGANKVVTVHISNLGNGEPAQQYSFNGGTTWQSDNKLVISKNTDFGVSTIQARDRYQKLIYNEKAFSVSFKYAKKGIDISANNGAINWPQVKAAGYEYAIIKALGYGNGYYRIDPGFVNNVLAAKAAGLKVGLYLYSYAFNPSEMAVEINYFHNSPEMAQLRAAGVAIDLPVFIDYEDTRVVDFVPDNATRTATVKYGMDMLRSLGYNAGFYTYYNFATNLMDARGLVSQGYDFWVADTREANYWGDSAVMWQYSHTASVPGISGNVDLNYLYKDYTPTGGGGGGTNKTLTVTGNGVQVTAPVETILAQIVEAEVGGFGTVELYKAQAIAAHSWILNQYSKGVSAPSVALKSPSAAVTDAVNSVKNVILTDAYGSVAFTPYFAYSNGVTNPGSYWGSDISYLQSVPSGNDAGIGATTRVISNGELKNNLTRLYGTDITAGKDPSTWITITARNSAGYATGVNVCGRAPTVDIFYQTILRYESGTQGVFELAARSPSFTAEYKHNTSYGASMWHFTSKGWGHCVGMSQRAAHDYAAQGWTTAQILSHFYRGTVQATI